MEIEVKTDEIKCPCCGSSVMIDIYEYDSKTLLATENGFHVFCSSTDFANTVAICTPSYDEGIELQVRCHKHITDNKLTVRP